MDKLEKLLEQIDEKIMSICSEHMNGDCIIDAKLENDILGIKRSIIDTYGVPYHLESYADTFKIVFDDKLKARKTFFDWYFNENTIQSTISLMKEELIEDGKSVWNFEELLETCKNIPKDIEQVLKEVGYLDNEGKC